jgi:hypothetical protein
MANKNMQGKQSAPRYASIMGQPHMLAYINQGEEKMIREAGGAGTPGPGGVPAYWTLTEPSTWFQGDGAGYEGTGNFNASDNDSSSGVTSSPRPVSRPTTITSSNNSSGNSSSVVTNPDTTWTTGNMYGTTVEYTGTPGEGDFFVKDTSDIDPYEYVELINADYSDNAAFDMSHYQDNEDHAADVAFYTENPNSNITTEQYGKALKITKAIGIAAGPLGLGARSIIELQRRGILPGNTATGWFPKNNIEETTGSSTDTLVLEMAEAGATNEEIGSALEKVSVENELSNKITSVDTMYDAAYKDSSAGDASTNPENYFSDMLSDKVPTLDADASGTNIDKTNYTMDPTTGALVEKAGEASTIDDIAAKDAVGFDVETVSETLEGDEYKTDAVVGEVNDDMLVDAEGNSIDVEETALGLNAVGKALNEFASIDTSRIINTSTVEGKLLADKLGVNGYVDSKSTILGQMEIISAEFKDSNGNPKIPSWAQMTFRDVSRTMAFSGVTGTAAMAATTNAMMETSLGVAEKEATFFQTLAVENLSNEQEALINKATVLSNFEMANLDARMTAAVQNAKSFLEMDLTNLNNEQQVEIINVETRVNAILEDAKAVNAERLFSAEEANDFTTFYDELSFQIGKHKADALNEMSRFNTGEINDNAEFNADLDVNREKFYKELAYNIDLSNAKWRRDVTLTEAEMEFDAAKVDTENMFGITSEALNRVWDREDAYFDYVWKSTETEMERFVDLYEIDKEYAAEMLKINNASDAAKGAADYELFKIGVDIVDSDIWDLF